MNVQALAGAPVLHLVRGLLMPSWALVLSNMRLLLHLLLKLTPAAAPDASSFGNSEGCGGQSKAFTDCLNSHVSDISKCQVYMDMLQECRTSSGVA
ncbi:hypothetical protein SLA2020_399690 [Shorea laevis]